MGEVVQPRSERGDGGVEVQRLHMPDEVQRLRMALKYLLWLHIKFCIKTKSLKYYYSMLQDCTILIMLVTRDRC